MLKSFPQVQWQFFSGYLPVLSHPGCHEKTLNERLGNQPVPVMKGPDYNGFIYLVQLVKDWNMCHLGPCELPGHIRDQLEVRRV